MTVCASVCWGRLEQQKVRCIREEGHDAAHTDGRLEWESKPPCPTCIDGTGVLLDVENESSNCPTCRPSYEELKAKVGRLESEVSLQKTMAAAAGVCALLGHNCPPTTMAAEWEEAARMFRASWEAEKEVSADAYKLGYAAAVVDMAGLVRSWRPCGEPTRANESRGFCTACHDEVRGAQCSNDLLEEAASKIEKASPGSLDLVEAAVADRKDAIQALRNIAAILDGDGGHRQDKDASFAATVERIHKLVCDMRAALEYAGRAPAIIQNVADVIDEETAHIYEEESDEIRDYASQLQKMLEKVAPKPEDVS